MRRLSPVVVIPPTLQRAARWLYGKYYHLPPSLEIPPPLALVFDAKAACRVLADYRAFPVRLYGDKMHDTFGDFLLGLDYSNPDYHRQVALLRAVIEPEDHARIHTAARRAATQAVGTTSTGEINVVAMMQAVVAQFVEEYFGIPDLEPSTGETLLRLNQRTASYVFNLQILTGHLREDAKQAGARIRAHLSGVFQRRLDHPDPAGETVVDRMVARAPTLPPPGAPSDTPADWSADQLATLAGGTISGLLVPTTAQFLAVVDRLLDLPPGDFDLLCTAARIRHGAIDKEAAGDGTAADDGRMQRFVLEAARFNPFPSGLQRYCAAHVTLETGSGRHKRIPAAATVLALMNAVALDPRLATRPGTFAIARPAGEYVLFGTGQHHCIGATRDWPIATELMTEMATALFSRSNLQRATGKRGEIHKDRAAQWPDSLYLTFGRGTR